MGFISTDLGDRARRVGLDVLSDHWYSLELRRGRLYALAYDQEQKGRVQAVNCCDPFALLEVEVAEKARVRTTVRGR